MRVFDNPALTALDRLGSLTTVEGDLGIYDNPVLPQCDACALLDQLVDFSSSSEIRDNQTDTCADGC